MRADVKLIGDLDRVTEEEGEYINKTIDRFLDKHKPDFGELYLSIQCQREKETSRGRPKYATKINLDSDHGRFHAENHDFGVEKTISGALDKVERQLKKK